MVSISKRQKELNDDIGSYLDRRHSKDSSGSSSFFKKVESLIPAKGNSESVPDLNDTEATVYDKPKKRFSLFSIFSRGSRDPADYEMDDEELEAETREDMQEVEHEIEAVDEEFEEIEQKRTGLFKRLFSFLSFGGPKVGEDDISEDHIREQVEKQQEKDALYKETRETLKILHKWINRLPSQQIESFKRSPDFQKYKNLLDKYNLIK
ncbi:MAG: hypothetical protein ACQESE_04545 [Nanobdellota archaeon]